jgi:predicted  nucleic acid-binding Zn-ribbon protein
MRVVCVFASVAVASGATASPVTRVVTLLNELKAKVEADGREEQQVYDKFACWCEKTTGRKAKDIQTAKEHIEELSEEIKKRKGQLGSLSAELAQLKKDINSNEQSQKDANSLRKKEHGKYAQTKDEMEEAIGALEKAINALSGAGMASLVSTEARMMDVAADLRGALELAPRGIVTSEQIAGVRGFLTNPSVFTQTAAKASGVDTYAPASNEIVGILKDMFQTFTANLETASATEAEDVKVFEDLMAAKSKELSDLQNTLEKKEAENAEATSVEADSQQDREDTSAQLAADEQFFDDTKASCREKANDWALRSRLRTEELAGIEKAVEILDSPEAQSAFESATTTFVQVRGVSKKLADARTKAFNALKKVSRRNPRMALLAAAVGTQTGWEFGSIISQTDKMIAAIRKEEAEDVAAKQSCDEMEGKANAKKADLQGEIDHITNRITKLNTRISSAQQEIVDTDGDIDAQKQLMENAIADRNAEHEDFVAALKDDEAAVKLLEQARNALAAYEKNNKDALSMLQKHKRDPEYTVDQDKAPDASFSSGKSHDTESKGIVGIIEMIKEDLENEIKQEKQKEADDQAQFEKEKEDFKKALKALDQRKADLEEEIGQIEEKIAQKNADKKNTENDKQAAQDTLDKLKPSCDWVAQTFEQRRENRRLELEELMESEATLQGASEDGGAASTEGGFLQRR